MHDQLQWLKLMSMSWLGPTLQAGLIKRFINPINAAKATIEEILDIQGFDYKRAARFLREFYETKPICSTEEISEKGIRFVNYNEEEYPVFLKEIADAPVGLFVKGKLCAKAPTIAIIGSRNGTQMGYDIAREFASTLAKAGFVIISGLALGIDTHAHIGALEAKSQTIAVTASGLDIVYPKGNQKVRKRIIEEGGAIVSEYPPGMPALPWHFPVRNRIISGMSMGILVIEANAQSGSLITARLAGEQNRDIFAIPGNINQSCAQGTIALLKDGAEIVTDPEDLINYYSDSLPNRPIKKSKTIVDDMTDDEKKLYDILAKEPLTVDSLLDNGWKPEILFSLLLQLEMRDYIIKLPNNCYQSRLKENRRK